MGDVDLVLNEELESEDCDELADLDLTHELLLTVLPYAADEEDTRKVSNTALQPVPNSVTAELRLYEEHRMAAFNRHRSGASVVTSTIESDRGNALRFLGFLKRQCEQSAPSLKLFAHARVGEWCQKWLEWLRDEHSLKSSTLAVYTNGVISVSSFALTLVDAPEACPVHELLNLRRQAESLSKVERLYQPKSPHWISWEVRRASPNAFRARRSRRHTCCQLAT